MPTILSKKTSHLRTICQLLGLCISIIVAIATDASETKHLGVASCSSSTCHGSTVSFADSNVLRNEFRVWYEQDPHAQAYQTLLTPESQEISRKLGIEAAHKADICLDCHTDFVPVTQRGTEFDLADGVGCEACHGGAENYLSSHTLKNHKDNLNKGLRKTEDPIVRGEICVSCHIGDHPTRQITHTIMGAGHPRLSFELNTFSKIQPAHFNVDNDYTDRKGSVNELSLWASGQVVAAKQLLHNLKSSPRSGLFPEFAHMDCLGCHQSMKKITWTKDPITQLRPGALRYQDAHLMMSYHIARVLTLSLIHI